jgi:DNA-binding LacI/PurR family transcriptional regulator
MARRDTRLADLAAMAGVSVSTASRALNDSPAINPRTKQRIWKLRASTTTLSTIHARGPIGATGHVALVVPRPQGREGLLNDPFFLELFAA